MLGLSVIKVRNNPNLAIKSLKRCMIWAVVAALPSLKHPNHLECASTTTRQFSFKTCKVSKWMRSRIAADKGQGKRGARGGAVHRAVRAVHILILLPISQSISGHHHLARFRFRFDNTYMRKM
ncbi:hypothetical protein EVAR_29825_1 [Eumeta japonica]|uniref:Uncharacterized protein n=1 Tax=Eumeta variegata TaxID=151549 RepID=A0A4C1VSZ2_EUMVA|nr:hypothetical protein EVAR_29825_1 [Eumeta japonica]